MEYIMNKLLILDKSVFQGTTYNELIRFVKCHCVILPRVLCVECAISQKGDPPKNSKDPMHLTQKILDVVKNGAYIGKSPGKIIEEEKSRNAAIESLIDVEETQTMKEGILDENPDLEKVREECDKAFKSTIDFMEQWMDQCHNNMVKMGLEKDFREEVDENDLVGRLTRWLQAIDEKKSDNLDHFFGNGRNVMKADRWEWQLLRLCLAWGTELACRRNKSGSSFDNYKELSNDIFDIHYVSHLSQVDGLITSDKTLVQPLAKAAFPGKDIFDSIDDVPYCYCKGN